MVTRAGRAPFHRLADRRRRARALPSNPKVLTRRLAPLWLVRTTELVPPVVVLAIVIALSVNVPFRDEWTVVPYIQRFRSGDLTLSELWAQHNEHRMAVPRVLILLLASLTRWNLRIEVIVGVVLAVVTYLGVRVLLRQSLGRDDRRLPAATLLCAFLVFSAVQWENWLFGFQLAWFLAVLGLVAAVVGVGAWPSRWPRWTGFAVAIFGALVASMSTLQGLFVWPAVLILLVVQRSIRRSIVWLFMGATLVTLYFVGFESPGHHPGLGATLDRPDNYLLYVFRYLAGGLSPPPRIARFGSWAGLYETSVAAWTTAVGVVLVVIFLLTIRAHVRRRTPVDVWATWAGIGAFSIFTAVATGAARVGFGIEQAQSSRYTTMSIPLAIATLALVLALPTGGGQVRRPIRGLALAALVLGVAAGYAGGLPGMLHIHHRQAELAGCIDRAQAAEELCMRDISTSREQAWSGTLFLRRIGWAGFHP